MIEVVNIGDLIYHPMVEPGNAGFAIEEISVVKLIGLSNNPYGYPWIIWTYGNVDFIKERDVKRNGDPAFFLKKDCYSSIEECIEFLENKRIEMIEFQKEKREQALAEVVETKLFLKELQKESVNISRQSNKNVAMLNKLDLRRDFEKRGLI